MKISYTSQTVFTQFLFFLLLIPSPSFLPSPFPVKFIASPIIIIEIDRQTDRAACCPYVPVFRVDGADLRNLGSCCPLLRSSHWWPAALHRCVGHYEIPPVRVGMLICVLLCRPCAGDCIAEKRIPYLPQSPQSPGSYHLLSPCFMFPESKV